MSSSFTVGDINVNVVESDEAISFFWSTFVGLAGDEFVHEVKFIDSGHVVTRFRTIPGGWSSYRVMSEQRWRDLRTRDEARAEVEKFVAEVP